VVVWYHAGRAGYLKSEGCHDWILWLVCSLC
jgi:hypothetical protein